MTPDQTPPTDPEPKAFGQIRALVTFIVGQVGSLIVAAEGLAKQISGLVIVVTGMLVAATALMVAIHGGTQNQILKDVNSGKDIAAKAADTQQKAIAVEVRGNEQDVKALAAAATQPVIEPAK